METVTPMSGMKSEQRKAFQVVPCRCISRRPQVFLVPLSGWNDLDAGLLPIDANEVAVTMSLDVRDHTVQTVFPTIPLQTSDVAARVLMNVSNFECQDNPFLIACR